MMHVLYNLYLNYFWFLLFLSVWWFFDEYSHLVNILLCYSLQFLFIDWLSSEGYRFANVFCVLYIFHFKLCFSFQIIYVSLQCFITFSHDMTFNYDGVSLLIFALSTFNILILVMQRFGNLKVGSVFGVLHRKPNRGSVTAVSEL